MQTAAARCAAGQGVGWEGIGWLLAGLPTASNDAEQRMQARSRSLKLRCTHASCWAAVAQTVETGNPGCPACLPPSHLPPAGLSQHPPWPPAPASAPLQPPGSCPPLARPQGGHTSHRSLARCRRRRWCLRRRRLLRLLVAGGAVSAAAGDWQPRCVRWPWRNSALAPAGVSSRRMSSVR